MGKIRIRGKHPGSATLEFWIRIGNKTMPHFRSTALGKSENYTVLIFIFLVIEADMQQLSLDITRTSVI
jgi:hypothetical protein